VLQARAHPWRAAYAKEDDPLRHLPLVMQASAGFLETVHYAPDPERYFFVLDWQATNRPESGRFGIQQHKHMEAWRRAFPAIFGDRIVDSEDFLAAHDEFLVLTFRDYRRQCSPNVRGIRTVRSWLPLHCPQWVAQRIADNPAFEMTETPSGRGDVILHVRVLRRDPPQKGMETGAETGLATPR
jgi:hypothetical protein